MPQEKMELDLEIPSSLVQSDGHLRRSNSAPMINGLRFSIIVNKPYIFASNYPSFTGKPSPSPLFQARPMNWTWGWCVYLWLSLQRQLPGVPKRSAALPKKQHHCCKPAQHGKEERFKCCLDANSFLSDSVTDFFFFPSLFVTGSFVTNPGPQHQTSSDQTSKEMNWKNMQMFVSDIAWKHMYKMQQYLWRS